MTEYTAVTDWALLANGTKVRATRENEHVEFIVAGVSSSGDSIRNELANIQLCIYDHPAWKLEAEKVAVVIPTEPGWYFDRDGDPWEVDESVTLREQWAPYTRIRTEAEVAAEVADYLEVTEWSPYATASIMALAIRSKFGAKK